MNEYPYKYQTQPVFRSAQYWASIKFVSCTDQKWITLDLLYTMGTQNPETSEIWYFEDGFEMFRL